MQWAHNQARSHGFSFSPCTLVFFFVLTLSCVFLTLYLLSSSPSIPSSPRDNLNTNSTPETTKIHTAHPRVLLLVLTTWEHIVPYLSALSKDWALELTHLAHIKVRFVVGWHSTHVSQLQAKFPGQRDAFETFWARKGRADAIDEALEVEMETWQLEVMELVESKLRDAEVWMVHAPDRSYPPVLKTVSVFDKVAEEHRDEYDVVVNVDDDTYVSPERLLQLARRVRVDVPVYTGRPLHHCFCTLGKDKECPREAGTSYCSGMGYAMNMMALEKMVGRWRACLWRHRDGLRECRSSDSAVGLCFNEVGIRCTPALAADGKLPTHRVSWAEPNSQGEKQVRESVMCQDPTHQGGVADVGNVGAPVLFDEKDWRLCAMMHPLKSAAAMRFARFLSSGAVEEPLLPDHPVQCELAIGVLSVVNQPRRRHAVRRTWMQMARALRTVKVMFVVGQSGKATPEELEAFEREKRQYGDIVDLPVADSYANLFRKSVAWFRWASEHAQCRFVMKTDDDTYIRVLPLLHFLSKTFPARAGPELLGYFGWQWERSAVNKDPDSPWYMHDMYPHDFFPPYNSGSGYGMSATAARYVADMAPRHPSYRCEDAGIGIVLSELRDKGLRYETSSVWQYDKCETFTVLDNPAFSLNFTLASRFEADVNGRFCEVSERVGLTSAGVHVEMGDAVFVVPHSRFNQPAPWDRGWTSRVPADSKADRWEVVRDEALDEHSRAVVARVFERVRAALPTRGCTENEVLGALHRTWLGSTEFVALGRCERESVVMAYVVVQSPPPLMVGEYEEAPERVNVAAWKWVFARPIVVVVRVSGELEQGKAFVQHTSAVLGEVGGDARIVVEGAEVPEDLVCESAQGVPCSVAREDALEEVDADDLVVALGEEMRVDAQYFLHSRALAQRGHSVLHGGDGAVSFVRGDGTGVVGDERGGLVVFRVGRG